MIQVNPYRPGAGMIPAYLAGRQHLIDEATKLLETISVGFPARSVIYYGLRGVGKTVLLNHMESVADELDIVSEYMEVRERSGSFQQDVALYTYKLINKLSVKENVSNHLKKALSVLKAFAIKYACGEVSIEISVEPAKGIADTGVLSNDLMELLLALGNVAKAEQKGVVLFIDEIQSLTDAELESLMMAIHRSNQRGLPLIIMAAGLPKIAKLAGDVKSYAERLFSFISIGTLGQEDAEKALQEPASRFGVTYESQALEKILDVTEGYPYFLQEYGKWVWESRKQADQITADDVSQAYTPFEQSLDESFFKVRHDRATPRELEFMIAMVKCNALPCSTKDIAKVMGESVPKISPLRAQLIHKGFIYAAQRGAVDFTVPQFNLYLKRMHLV